MKLITLVENSQGASCCACEHGLSIYIETNKHKILMDAGASDAFIKNAEILGVDLREVDMMVLSHGHYDHAGGIMDFIKINPKATIYMRPTAVKAYYSLKASGVHYIGLDERIFALPQIKYTKEKETFGEQISLFSDINGRKLWPKGNEQLKVCTDGIYEQDVFDHEQCLVIRENGKSVLISGCAHNGVINILDKYQELYNGLPDVVVTGFHMKSSNPFTVEEKELVRSTAEILSTMKDTVFYSGHCTGEEAFGIMKEIMGDQLQALHSGDKILP